MSGTLLYIDVVLTLFYVIITVTINTSGISGSGLVMTVQL